jgi:hypothetical protein
VTARRAPAAAGAVVTAALLGWSAVRDVPRTLSVIRGEHGRFAAYTRLQRDEAFGALLPLPMDIFEWYRQYLRPGDRYYVQVENGAFGRFIDKETAVRSVARLYLLPAVEASSLADANVVLSFDSDPGSLHLRFSQQWRSGVQLIFVSRIAGAG